MFTFEEICETACAKRSIPNAIVHAADRKGDENSILLALPPEGSARLTPM